jgi:hypothetical protein
VVEEGEAGGAGRVVQLERITVQRTVREVYAARPVAARHPDEWFAEHRSQARLGSSRAASRTEFDSHIAQIRGNVLPLGFRGDALAAPG